MTITHPHGTLGRYQAGCRQECCRAAQRDYTRRRRRALAAGRWSTFVDAAPIRQHVIALREAGLSLRQVAELAGTQVRQIDYLIYGDPGRGWPPQRRIRPNAAHRILAVSPVPRRLPSRGWVDGTGTRRRLQALVAIGWSLPEVAARLGRKPHSVIRLATTGAKTHVDTARAIRGLYAELWNQPGPSARARANAARRGWPPPLAWDDDTIDNPAVPAAGPLRSRPTRTRIEGSR